MSIILMRRILLATIGALCLCCPMLGAAAEAYPSIVPSLPDIEVCNDTGMVPAAPLVELMGGSVTPDKKTGSISVTLGGHVLLFTPGNPTAVCDGNEVTLPLNPFATKSGVLYVPVQALAAGLGCTTAIDIVRKQFTITVPKRKDPLTLTYTVVTDPANLGKDSDDEFYVIDLDGSHLRRLTYDSWDSGVSGDACLPVFIPKSDYFIYSHNGELVQRTAKDPTLFPLPAPSDARTGASFIPTGVSADGKTFLFTQPTYNMAPVFMRKSGEVEATLITAEGSLPALIPSGNLIACLHRIDRNFGVYLLTPDSEDRRCIEKSAGHAVPVFSPDSSMLAFQRETLVNENKIHWGMVIYRLTADNPGIISESPAEVEQESNLAFSPDSQWVAISGSGLRIMRPDRSESTTLSTWHTGNPQFTLDGQQILFVTGTTLYCVDRDGKNMHKVLSGLIIRDFTFTPDGKKIILCAKPDPNGTVRQAEKW